MKKNINFIITDPNHYSDKVTLTLDNLSNAAEVVDFFRVDEIDSINVCVNLKKKDSEDGDSE